MCADLLNLQRDIEILLQGGVDFFHIDFMDGHFVRNFGLCYDLVKSVRKITQIPLEVHLTIANPQSHIELSAEAGADIITIHPEVTQDLDKTLQDIRNLGKFACLAISPQIPISIIDGVLNNVDMINLLAVNPGFAGQKAIPSTFEKIKRLKEKLSIAGYDIPIQVDGNVSYENIPLMLKSGAEILVLGTSSLFQKNILLEESLKVIKEYIRKLEASI
jgi:ribulose-phosphate 3-epimerase